MAVPAAAANVVKVTGALDGRRNRARITLTSTEHARWMGPLLVRMCRHEGLRT